jgi:hypothetical protein
MAGTAPSCAGGLQHGRELSIQGLRGDRLLDFWTFCASRCRRRAAHRVRRRAVTSAYRPFEHERTRWLRGSRSGTR